MTIDHEGRVPVYQQVVAELRRQIDRGVLAENRPLPSKAALAEEFGVAKGTVEHALAVLKAAGYIETVIGRGMYVVPAAERHQDG